MTPDRLQLIIDRCFDKRRNHSRTAHYQDIARFLRIEVRTLKRWRSGERPVPWWVEVIMEAMHAWPDTFNAAAVMQLIANRDASTP